MPVTPPPSSPPIESTAALDSADRLVVIGIGASAGGLEALAHFFRGVPADAAQAFIVVQHLDPTKEGMLVELLQRGTALPVVQITDGMPVQGGRIHVMPPNRDLTVGGGLLHLAEPSEARGLRLPIDILFRSLAEESQEQAIGVVLSGMGSDGMLGATEIRARGGAIFVQSGDDAKFDPMPRSTADAKLADVVAPAAELYGRIVAYLAHVPPLADVDAEDPESASLRAVDQVVLLLRMQTGHDFAEYKHSTIVRRIRRRMGLHHLATLDAYAEFLRANPAEGELLFGELLIGVTSFFRDAPVWEQVRREVMPSLFRTRGASGTLRAWVAGCSTGEEAYTLAMTFLEARQDAHTDQHLTFQIFATDLDRDAIDKARRGSFPDSSMLDVSAERLERFFIKQQHGGYRMSKEVRDMVIFAPHNLVMDPPFTKIDLLSCRNLLIYLTPELQRKLLPLFHYSLVPGGYLVLGTAETAGTDGGVFAPLSGKTRIYRRLGSDDESKDAMRMTAALGRTLVDGVTTARTATRSPMNLQHAAEQLLLQRHAPAAVLVGDQGDVLFVSGRTGRYLEPAAGKANWNLFAMARPGLAAPVMEAMRRAARLQEHVVLDDVELLEAQGPLHVRVEVEPITDAGPMRGMLMVVFTDLPQRPAAVVDDAAAAPDAVREVAQLRAALRAAREEMQLSQQDLHSANEELQSANEELQSTNEELTTSKEEMQSMNEELQTVNHELQAKLDELTLASTDMANLLNSTSIATLFLDANLGVRRFTTSLATLYRLLPGDVGRPITDIVSSLAFPDLAAQAKEVLRTLAVFEREVATDDGRWFVVRIMPYRTQDDRIDGLVITYTDATRAKTLETALRAAGGEPSEGTT